MLAILADTAEHVTTWPEALMLAAIALSGAFTTFVLVKYMR